MISLDETELIKDWVDFFKVTPIPASKSINHIRGLFFFFTGKSDPYFSCHEDLVEGDRAAFVRQISNSIVSNWNDSNDNIPMIETFVKDRVSIVLNKIAETRFNSQKEVSYGVFRWRETNDYIISSLEMEGNRVKKLGKDKYRLFEELDFQFLPVDKLEDDVKVCNAATFVASYPKEGNGDFFITFGCLEDGLAITPLMDNLDNPMNLPFCEFEDYDSLDKKHALLKGNTSCFADFGAMVWTNWVQSKVPMLEFVRNFKESLYRALFHYSITAKEHIKENLPFLLGNLAVKQDGRVILYPSSTMVTFPPFVDSDENSAFKFDSRTWSFHVFGEQMIV